MIAYCYYDAATAALGAAVRVMTMMMAVWTALVVAFVMVAAVLLVSAAMVLAVLVLATISMLAVSTRSPSWRNRQIHSI